MPIFFLHWGREGRKALPHVATLGSAGGCGQDGGRGNGGDGGDGCGGGGPWKSTVEAVVTVPSGPRPCGARERSLRRDGGAAMWEVERANPAHRAIAHQRVNQLVPVAPERPALRLSQGDPGWL